MADHGVPMFVPLMSLNRELFTAGNYHAAYHLLAGALYVAGEDAQYLALVERVAREQLAEIDATHPEYMHSTPSAATRKMDSIFSMLARQARAAQEQVRIRLLVQERFGDVGDLPR